MMTPDNILEKASAGKLTDEEVRSVADVLRRGTAGDEYTLLLALGRAMGRGHRDIVEKYLDREDEPMLARLALQILCKFWGYSADYMDWIRRFVAGVDWDEEGDVRQMAHSVAGEFLREHDDKELLAQLLDMTTDDKLDEFERSDAYVSLARAMGKSWEELPSFASLPLLDELLDERVIESARERISRIA